MKTHFPSLINCLQPYFSSFIEILSLLILTAAALSARIFNTTEKKKIRRRVTWSSEAIACPEHFFNGFTTFAIVFLFI